MVMPKPTQMDLLNESYKKEVEASQTTSDIIEELAHYKSVSSEVRGLKEKLDEAGFGYLLAEGEELKELVAKIIVRYQHYRSAQRIITLLLSSVNSIFNVKIKPKLKSSNSEDEFRALMYEYLEQKVQSDLGENVLDIYHRQINGMVYFLTGNCHLRWK